MAYLKLKGGSAGILDLIFRVRVAPSFIYLEIINHFEVPLTVHCLCDADADITISDRRGAKAMKTMQELPKSN